MDCKDKQILIILAFFFGIMRGETPTTSGHQFDIDRCNDAPSDDINGNRSANNISLQTGEEFSEIFLREGVSPRRAAMMSDIDQKHQKRKDYDAVQNHNLGVHRGDSDSGAECSGFSPRRRYEFDADNEYYCDTSSRHNKGHANSGQQHEKLSVRSNIDITAPGSAGPSAPSTQPPDSYRHSSSVTRVRDGSFSGKMKFLCSFGGRILPRPNDGKLRYVGGETRIISIRKNLAYNDLVRKTTAICNQTHTIKYQLPGEDLDALISVCSDEDLSLMIEEYLDLEGSSQRLRIFLVPLNDPESPCSLEATTTQVDTNYQYVVAVNGIMDPSLRRSSSRESLTSPASQASMVGSTFDYSPTVQRESPTSTHPLQIQSGTSSKMRFASSKSQFLNSQTPFKQYFASPPVSPVTVHLKDSKSSHKKLYDDIMYADGHEYYSPTAMDQRVYDNFYYLDASNNYNNLLPERIIMKNPDQLNSHFTEFNKSSKPPCHSRKPSKEFVISPSHGQFEANKKRIVANDIAMPFENLLPSQDTRSLSPAKEAAGKYHLRMTRALSEAQLQVEDRSSLMSEDERSPFSWKFVLEKSPSFSGSSDEWLCQHIENSDKKICLQTRNKKQLLEKIPERSREYIQWRADKRNWAENKEPSLNQDGTSHRDKDRNIHDTTVFRHQINLPKVNLHTPISPAEQPFSKGSSSLSHSPSPENSRDNRRGEQGDCLVRPDESDSLVKSKKETKDQQDTSQGVYERKKDYCPSFNFNCPLNDNLSFPSTGTPLLKGLNVGELHDPWKLMEQGPHRSTKKGSSEKCSQEQAAYEDEISVLYQPMIKQIEVDLPESTVTVEDVTGHVSHDISSPSAVVPLVQYEPSDGISSTGGETEVETTALETDNEVI